MKGQLKVATPADYISKLAEPRKIDIAALDTLIRKTAPKLEPVVLMGMLGYGPYRYKYASGREGDACKIMLASNASYISLYVNGAGEFKDALPKASIGKSCVRFRTLGDLDQTVLKKLIQAGAKWKGIAQ